MQENHGKSQMEENHGKSQMEMQQHNRPPANNDHRTGYNNHHSAPAHAQYHGRRIPQDRYAAQFGRDHRFRVQCITIVQGHRRFQYGGYWFQLGNAWPVGWSYDDDRYIDDVGGFYYLYNPIHPGLRIQVIVVQ